MPDTDNARSARDKWLADLAAQAELDALPVYMPGGVPEGLATRRQLRADGLSAAGLKPSARLHYCAYHYLCPLYERSAARPVRPLTVRQREALAAGRALAGTALCRKCGQARTEPWSGDRWCRSCQKQDRQRRWDKETAARLREVEEVTSWARKVLADPATVVLDTETTGLGSAFMVEVAVLAVDGAVMLDTRVNPGVPIPDEAIEIHGISDADVRDCPTFADLWPRLRDLLADRRIVIYNADFDTRILLAEADRYYMTTAPVPRRQLTIPDRPGRRHWHPMAQEWKKSLRTECAMEQYATWYGEWSDYFGGYKWQGLGGGHSARSDCEAAIELLHRMTSPQADEPLMDRWYADPANHE